MPKVLTNETIKFVLLIFFVSRVFLSWIIRVRTSNTRLLPKLDMSILYGATFEARFSYEFVFYSCVVVCMLVSFRMYSYITRSFGTWDLFISKNVIVCFIV